MSARILNQAIALHQAGRLPEAEQGYREVLALVPAHPDANHNLGVVAMQTNRPTEALSFLKAALEAKPEIGQYWLSYVAALTQAGEATAARQVLAQAMQRGLRGPDIDALANRLAVRMTEAPTADEMGQALALFKDKRFAKLMPIARTLTERFPQHGFGWQLLGVVLKELGQHEEALPAMQRAVELLPEDAETHYNLALAYEVLGQTEAAEAGFRKALTIRPGFPEALMSLAALLQKRGASTEAEANLRRTLEIKPDAVTYRNLGVLLRSRGALAEAEACFRAVTTLDPESAEAFLDLGGILHAQGRTPEAETSYRHALTLRPKLAEASGALANIYLARGWMEEAEGHCLAALEPHPDSPELKILLGCIRRDQGRLDDAIGIFRDVLAAHPDYALAHDALLFVLNYHPGESAETIYTAYRDYDNRLARAYREQCLPHDNDRQHERVLKVGYVSPDLKRHSVRHFLEPLLARHDRRAFEIHAYAELGKEDEVTARYRTYVDHWLNTLGMSDDSLAERIHADGIDILVDLAGHTTGNRLLVFARKPAPVSVSWLGFGYTTGVSAIDYLLTDETSAPPGCDHLFAETPWRLKTPGFAYRPAEGMGEVNALPALTHGHVTFGTLTRAVRINHRVVRVWSEILKRLPTARLILDSVHFHDKSQERSLADQFAAYGINRERLEIGFHTPPWDVLRGMDIALDCFPHNSGTTLFESLYMGVPYVTLAGRPSVGRLGASILEGLGHPEWIAHTEAEYIDKAVALAGDLPKLAAIRAGLRQEMQASPLMDEAGFARKVEAAYRQMFRRWASEAPMKTT